jgi:hypothetical protein
VIAFWLPSLPAQAITGEEIVALGLPGYVFYLIFRSYLDAVDVRPLSSVATVLGLCALLALLAALLSVDRLEPTIAASAALAVALSVTGAVTLLLVNRRLGGLLRPRNHVAAPAACAGMVVAGLAVREGSLALVAATSVLLAAAYAAVLVISRPDWLMTLMQRPKER